MRTDRTAKGLSQNRSEKFPGNCVPRHGSEILTEFLRIHFPSKVSGKIMVGFRGRAYLSLDSARRSISEALEKRRASNIVAVNDRIYFDGTRFMFSHDTMDPIANVDHGEIVLATLEGGISVYYRLWFVPSLRSSLLGAALLVAVILALSRIPSWSIDGALKAVIWILGVWLISSSIVCVVSVCRFRRLLRKTLEG